METTEIQDLKTYAVLEVVDILQDSLGSWLERMHIIFNVFYLCYMPKLRQTKNEMLQLNQRIINSTQ